MEKFKQNARAEVPRALLAPGWWAPPVCCWSVVLCQDRTFSWRKDRFPTEKGTLFCRGQHGSKKSSFLTRNRAPEISADGRGRPRGGLRGPRQGRNDTFPTQKATVLAKYVRTPRHTGLPQHPRGAPHPGRSRAPKSSGSRFFEFFSKKTRLYHGNRRSLPFGGWSRPPSGRPSRPSTRPK